MTVITFVSLLLLLINFGQNLNICFQYNISIAISCIDLRAFPWPWPTTIGKCDVGSSLNFFTNNNFAICFNYNFFPWIDYTLKILFSSLVQPLGTPMPATHNEISVFPFKEPLIGKPCLKQDNNFIL